MYIPDGTTHYRLNGEGVTYYLIRGQSHRIWLGKKHGGWSMDIPYLPPKANKLIEVSNEVKRYKRRLHQVPGVQNANNRVKGGR